MVCGQCTAAAFLEVGIGGGRFWRGSGLAGAGAEDDSCALFRLRSNSNDTRGTAFVMKESNAGNGQIGTLLCVCASHGCLCRTMQHHETTYII